MIGQRVRVRRTRSAKYGRVVGETKDGRWVVLIDGNMTTTKVAKTEVEPLKAGDIAYHLLVGRSW